MEEVKEKLKVYCETSFWSYLTAKPSADPEKALRQAYTLRWWNEAAQKCDIFVSQYVLDEAQDGDVQAAKLRLSMITKAPVLTLDTEQVWDLMSQLLRGQQVLQNEITDAAHIAVSSISGMDVLLTWNCKHLANMVELPKTAGIVARCGYKCPAIITPKTFLEAFNV